MTTCTLSSCEQVGAEEVAEVLLCAEHALEAKKMIIRTIFGAGPNEMFRS